MNKKLILASASPRRRELLSIAGYDYEVIPSNAEEIKSSDSAVELVRSNALAKAREVFSRFCDGSYVVLGADTIVCADGEILGKPEEERDASNMLLRLSGREHLVITGFAVVGQEGEFSGACETKVFFKELTENEIDSYVMTDECYDKAGGYGIQERACLFVDRVEGDYFNVIGLPVRSICPILAEFGIKPNWFIK